MRFSPAELLPWALMTEATTRPSVAATAVCSALHARYPEHLVWDPAGTHGLQTSQRATVYHAALADYWNAASASNRPACALFPSEAEHVSFAVGTLGAHPSVPFALKGGGHNPNLGFSSVSGGLLIAFRPGSQFVVPAPDGETVRVGAGAKWENVYSALQPLGKTAVGGRLADVGVTGYMLGGGLSYLSAQYGFACDSVLSFECVLANGTMVQASPSSHPDLFFALRGGGNQYAVVTSMTLKTYDIGDKGIVWGGVRTYAADQASRILSAVSNFTANAEDPKAALIPNIIFAGAVGVSLPIALVFFFYDGRAPPAAIFDEFNAIPHLSSDTRARSYLSLTREVLGGDMKGLRFQIRENTFPNMPMPAMSSFLDDHFQHLLKSATAGALADLIDVRILTFAAQPMPRAIAVASQRVGGGNALGLVPEHGDRLWVEYNLAWTSPQCDEKCPAFLRKTAESGLRLHKQKYAGKPPTNYVEGDLGFVSYNPIFMNDAMADQAVLQSYGHGTYQRLRAIHQEYDPEAFFSTRQGGFKFSP